MTIEKSLPNMVMVCVDGVENGDIYGRYFHRYKKHFFRILPRWL